MLFVQTGVRYFGLVGMHLTAILRNALTVCHHLRGGTCHGSAWHVTWMGTGRERRDPLHGAFYDIHAGMTLLCTFSL